MMIGNLLNNIAGLAGNIIKRLAAEASVVEEGGGVHLLQPPPLRNRPAQPVIANVQLLQLHLRDRLR